MGAPSNAHKWARVRLVLRQVTDTVAVRAQEVALGDLLADPIPAVASRLSDSEGLGATDMVKVHDTGMPPQMTVDT